MTTTLPWPLNATPAREGDRLDRRHPRRLTLDPNRELRTMAPRWPHTAAGDVSAVLTPRQTEVLALMAQGHSNTAIARGLTISEKAVVQHTSQIYDRLGLFAEDDDTHRRVCAVIRYLASDRAA
jgi:DNA-binding NarL/FixJ family response regulator